MHERTSTPEVVKGPPIVLVHGLGVSSRYMAPLACELASDFPVHAVDLPGFGLSSKPEGPLAVPELARALAAWLSARKLERPVVVANSLGCQVVADLADVHGPALDRLVLLAPTVDPEARSILKHAGRWLLTLPWERQSLALVILRDWRAAGVARVRRTAALAAEDRIEDKLPRIAAPVLVVRGTRDRVCPQRWVERAAALAPRGRLELIDGAPHCLNYSAPRDSAEVVRRFLAD